MTSRSFFLTLALVSCGPTQEKQPVVGEKCPEENVGVCESPTRLLQCVNLQWVIASDCKGPDGCRRDGTSVKCDTSANSLGDRCLNIGRVRCEPDAGLRILRCNDAGVLVSQVVCPFNQLDQVQTRCAMVDGGLDCL
jgi:hypothetical protein